MSLDHSNEGVRRMEPFFLLLAMIIAGVISKVIGKLTILKNARRSIQIISAAILLCAVWLIDSVEAQGPTPTPTPPPPGILGFSNDFWEKAILAILGGAVALIFQKILPWLWQRAGKVYDWLSTQIGWDPLGKFEKRYLSAMRREHGDLKLIGIRTEGVAPPKLEQVYVSLRVVPPHLASLTQRDSQPERVLGVGVALREYSRLMVLGAPGAGKSTLLDYLTLGFADGLPQDKRQSLALKERYLPIYIPLRRCATVDKTLADALVDPALKILPPDLLTQCPASFFQKRLEQGKCLVLLDGLDEVTSAPHYQAMLAKINSLVTTYPKNRFVVTCRVAGWHGGLGGDFTVLEIQDFQASDVERFVQGWYRAVLPERELRAFSGTPVERQAALKRAQENADGEARKLLALLATRERLGLLAANPMMLSLIAFVHYTRRDLPRGRAALYKECVEILLHLWDERDKELHLDNAPHFLQKEAVLRRIAYDFQVTGKREAPRAELETLIAQMLPTLGSAVCASEFLRQIEQRSGLLVERAVDVLGFSHLTFQEYLTALVFKDDDGKRPELLAHRAEQEWREVILLYGGMLPRATEWLTALWQAEGALPLLAGECLAEAVQVEPTLRDQMLATLNHAFRTVRDPATLWSVGQVLADVSGKDAADYFLAALDGSTSEVRQIAVRALRQAPTVQIPRIAPVLLTLAQNDADENIRLGALDTLGQFNIHTPVPGIAELAPILLRYESAKVRAAAATLLDSAMVEIPAGPFKMGSDKRRDRQATDSEFPQHEVTLQAYRIGKYPVTNAQFARFVAAGGYEQRAYWTDAGWEWKGKQNGPARYEEKFNVPEQPVVGVAWHEAVAYCRWLTETTGRRYRLPTEAEWEKAARGTDSRIYPWDNSFDVNKCNVDASKIGNPSAVGTYSPGGDSPYGVTDMAGNVWEWCSSLYKKYPYDPKDGREDLNSTESRILRGGSWLNYLDLARCASRYFSNPDYRDIHIGFRVAESLAP
jgi:formylglycine-generating enzyme required for sulfatase activity